MHPSGIHGRQEAQNKPSAAAAALSGQQAASEPIRESASILDEVAALLDPDLSADAFMGELLATQCRLAGADGGALLQRGPENRVDILRVHPPLPEGGRCDSWVAMAAAHFVRRVAADGRTAVIPEPKATGAAPSLRRHIIVIPIHSGGAVVAAAAFVLQACPSHLIEARCDRLELTPFLLRFNDLRLTLARRLAGLDRLCEAMAVLSAFNRPSRFLGAAMALCNEVAARWRCSRVSLGFVHGREVHVQAMSNTENVSRRMRLVQGLETVMEECLDQDLEIVLPSPDPLAFVHRAAERFSAAHGPAALASLPVRRAGDVCAVMTLERAPERPFSSANLEAIRLTCDLCASRLVELQERDRWFGARMAAGLRRALGRMAGPRHALAKIAGTLVLLGAVVLAGAGGDHRIEAPFVFETTMRQAVVAPFDAYLEDVLVAPGDAVRADETTLGQLEVSDLRLELAALKAERLGMEKQAAAAVRDMKTVDAQIARAESEKVAAQIDLLEARLRQGTLIAPMTGRIISKDLKQQVGAPVETGTVLFEIAPLDALRAEVFVPEDSISDVAEGQTGRLVSVGHPDQKIPFTVERIHPVAEVVHQRNVFRVRVKLADQPGWMRPGMEGMAKISVGEKPYIWIGTRRLVNWLRMTFWL